MSVRTKILIMCGGRGKRLGDLTEDPPKPLVKINDKTILENKIYQYQSQGFNDYIFCIGYRGDMIKNLIDEKTNIIANYSDAGLDAGILFRLNYAKDLFEDSVLMTYGDTYTDLELNALIKTHNNSDNEATIVVSPIQNPFGLVEFDKNNQVTYFKEKPILNYYIGYAIINKSSLDILPKSSVDLPDGQGLVELYRTLQQKNLLGCYYHSGLEATFNTKEELVSAKNKMNRFYTAIVEN